MIFMQNTNTSIMPEAFDNLWSNARNLTHEAAIAEAKQRIAGLESKEELGELLRNLIGKREGYIRLVSGFLALSAI